MYVTELQLSNSQSVVPLLEVTLINGQRLIYKMKKVLVGGTTKNCENIFRALSHLSIKGAIDF
jgi:hypothetical protein